MAPNCRDCRNRIDSLSGQLFLLIFKGSDAACISGVNKANPTQLVAWSFYKEERALLVSSMSRNYLVILISQNCVAGIENKESERYTIANRKPGKTYASEWEKNHLLLRTGKGYH